MGVSYGIDLSQLDVCFGGFSPTLMGDAFATAKNIDDNIQRLREQRLANIRAAELRAARESEERTYREETGIHTIQWTYVTIDDAEVKINRCAVVSDDAGIDLVVPSSLEDLPVTALESEAMTSLKGVRSITVPDSIIYIGACAFRNNHDLIEAVLPAHVAEFKSDWFRSCSRLEALTLPGELDTLSAAIFDIPNLKVLHIGAAASSVNPGAFAKSQLDAITIAEDNPYMRTDGIGIYNREGTVMAALAIPIDRYDIAPGCKALGNKALSTMKCLTAVNCPDSLEVIGNFAFAKTGITAFVAPPSLKVIMEKAFFDCTDLTSVKLNDGLRIIEQNAFTSTAIESLTLPPTIEQLDYPFAARTALTYSGAHATFALAPDSQLISMDGSGGLYRKGEDGLHLIRMLDEGTRAYDILPGTISIDDDAFNAHPSIERVNVPASVRTIGAAAFKDCHALTTVNLQEGIASIGKDAFLNTALEAIFIPSTLTHIDENALVTRGPRHSRGVPSLHRIEVAPENERFYLTDGLLLERKNERTSRIVISADDRPRVVVPPEVDEIAPYAFNGAANLHELFLSDRISTVGIRGLTPATHLDLLHIDLVKPIDGHDHFDLSFPDTTRGIQQLHLALSTSAFINVEAIFANYDTSIINASSFDAFSEEGLDLYEQAIRVIDRLKDPIFLSDSNRAMCERILENGIEQICVEMAKRDDRESIDELVELGYLNEDNILSVIDRVGAVQDASMTGYLLEISRRWTTADYMDFEL